MNDLALLSFIIFTPTIGALILGFSNDKSEGWMRGWMDNIWKTTIHYQTGNVRITTEEFFKQERFLPVDEYISGSDNLIAKIRSIPGVTNVEERLRFGILLGKGDLSEPAIGMGVDIRQSSLNIGRKIVEGSLADRGIYIGTGLARKLGVKIGNELLLATKTSEGGLNGIKLKVAGIFHYGITFLDKQYFFIDLADSKKLLKLNNAATEIYVFTAKPGAGASPITPCATAPLPKPITPTTFASVAET